MLTRLQRLFPALLACILLCLPLTLRAHSRQAITRPAPRLRTIAAAKKMRKPEFARASSRSREHARHAGRVLERKEVRAVKPVRGLKPLRASAVLPKRLERVRTREIEPSKTIASLPKNTPEGVEDSDDTSAVRNLYLARQQAAKPVSVVSTIRPITDRPQFPDTEEVAAKSESLLFLYDKGGRLVMPAPLRGSHEILVHQNEVADRDGLARVRDDGDLEDMRRRSILVALPVGGGIQVDERLPANRRYCRPWTANFLLALARAHSARFQTTLQVNSAVRTVAIQQRLLRTNGNAAPVAGETASPHLTGQAVDIAKRGLSASEIAWMRGYLLPLIEAGKIDVEEEFQQSCFHISVYRSYLPALDEIAVTHRERSAALAIMLH